ncbi:hypothetical protein JM93_03144 [Roseibium hamelinense]|uniref:MFS transporter n=1 Tax=Roseibium hamelinense TaxID=150831 RepID=A0A562SUP0_9HYPH|nr:hypothetical protein [Roseibium hamelinense]MTI42550.1 hypothetical protein [Roseibium hamelinense]TWI84808.1 hypothetical protein JM93_03144 [Roseibium hamelinense]
MARSETEKQATYYVRSFLLLNLFGFPVAGYVSSLLARTLAAANVSGDIIMMIALSIGICLILANAWFVFKCWRAGGISSTLAALALWTFACIATLLLYSTYSPLNLAMLMAAG